MIFLNSNDNNNTVALEGKTLTKKALALKQRVEVFMLPEADAVNPLAQNHHIFCKPIWQIPPVKKLLTYFSKQKTTTTGKNK